MTNEIIHGRSAFSNPLGTDGLLHVVFSGEGPLPDYDIAGWEGDVPIGGYSPQRTKISRDYRHYADALFKWEEEGTKKTVTRPRGALYILCDKGNDTWAIWLETWADYFSRSHILKSPELVEREKVQAKGELDAEYAKREASRLEQQKAELNRPTTWIAIGIFVVAIIAALIRWISGPGTR